MANERNEGRPEVTQSTDGSGPEESLATAVREEFGFRRMVCACRKCSLWCEYVPGALVPSDLNRLIPSGDDPLDWAKDHLLASPGFRRMDAYGRIVVQIPTLVPKRQENGFCHWLEDGLCLIHDNSPFGCAFVSQCQQTAEQAELRNIAARQARARAFQEGHLYSQIWGRLWDAGVRELTTQENLHRGLRELERLDNAEERPERNAQRKAKRKAKKK